MRSSHRRPDPAVRCPYPRPLGPPKKENRLQETAVVSLFPAHLSFFPLLDSPAFFSFSLPFLSFGDGNACLLTDHGHVPLTRLVTSVVPCLPLVHPSAVSHPFLPPTFLMYLAPFSFLCGHEAAYAPTAPTFFCYIILMTYLAQYSL